MIRPTLPALLMLLAGCSTQSNKRIDARLLDVRTKRKPIGALRFDADFEVVFGAG